MNNNPGIFSIFKNLNLSKILTGANKTLGIVKQVVPIYQDIKPVIGNARNVIKTYNSITKPKIIQKKVVSPRTIIRKQPLKDVTINNNLTFFQ